MEIFGWLGTLIVSIQFLPQLIKSIKTKNTKSLSFYMIFLVIVGSIFWFVHGIIIGDMPLIITNTMVFLITGMLFFIKLKYK
jgi:MtN3 and saliva related transmembrane protein